MVGAGGGTLEFDFLKCLISVFPGLARVFLCGMWILVVEARLEVQGETAVTHRNDSSGTAEMPKYD